MNVMKAVQLAWIGNVAVYAAGIRRTVADAQLRATGDARLVAALAELDNAATKLEAYAKLRREQR